MRHKKSHFGQWLEFQFIPPPPPPKMQSLCQESYRRIGFTFAFQVWPTSAVACVSCRQLFTLSSWPAVLSWPSCTSNCASLTPCMMVHHKQHRRLQCWWTYGSHGSMPHCYIWWKVQPQMQAKGRRNACVIRGISACQSFRCLSVNNPFISHHSRFAGRLKLEATTQLQQLNTSPCTRQHFVQAQSMPWTWGLGASICWTSLMSLKKMTNQKRAKLVVQSHDQTLWPWQSHEQCNKVNGAIQFSGTTVWSVSITSKLQVVVFLWGAIFLWKVLASAKQQAARSHFHKMVELFCHGSHAFYLTYTSCMH